jgi:hypothetical protein
MEVKIFGLSHVILVFKDSFFIRVHKGQISCILSVVAQSSVFVCISDIG